MKSIKTLFSVSILVLSLAFVGCSDDDSNGNMNNIFGSDEPTMDIVETAIADGRFNTLVTAVQAADLVEALKGEGPLTVFAPTDDAFAKLPEGTVEALLQDIDALTAILTYHVVPGEVKAEQVVSLNSAPTLNGQSVTISVTNDGKVMIDNATVIITDIETTNGIIHVIDEVILPSTSSSTSAIQFESSIAVSSKLGFGSYSFGGGWIAEAIKDGRLQWLTKRLSLYTVSRLTGLSILNTAVKEVGLSKTLRQDGPFTLFGPTNEAFAALPEGTIPALLNDPATLTNILLYHVVPGVVTSAEVVNLTEATMANGGNVMINVDDNGVMINDSKVIVVDIPARNGVIHLIDAVLIPAE